MNLKSIKGVLHPRVILLIAALLILVTITFTAANQTNPANVTNATWDDFLDYYDNLTDVDPLFGNLTYENTTSPEDNTTINTTPQMPINSTVNLTNQTEPFVSDGSAIFHSTATSCDYNISACKNSGWVAGATYCLDANIASSSTSYCIDITEDNINFDCRGHTISGNNAADYGIRVSRASPTATNVTIQNCILSSWDSGQIYLNNADNNSLINNTARNTDENSFYLYASSHNWLVNNSAITMRKNAYYLSTGSDFNILANNRAVNGDLNNQGPYSIAFDVYKSNNNTFLHNTGNVNAKGFYFAYSSGNTIANNTATNNRYYGYSFAATSENNTVVNNTASITYMWVSSGANTFAISSCDNFLNFTDNYGKDGKTYLFVKDREGYDLQDSGYAGIFFCNVSDSVLDNITIYNRYSSYPQGSDGLYLYYSDNITVINSNITYTYHGVHVYKTNNSRIVNNNLGYSHYGVHVTSSSYDIIANNTEDYAYDGFIIQGDFITVVNNSASNYKGNGVGLESASDCQVNGNLIYHSYYQSPWYYDGGLSISSSYRNNITNNAIVLSEDETGILVSSCSTANCTTNNTIYNNFLYNTLNTKLYAPMHFLDWNNTLGGNYWGALDGDGFSQTCTDANNDSICDSAMDVTTELTCTPGVDCSNNTDYLPLAYHPFIEYMTNPLMELITPDESYRTGGVIVYPAHRDKSFMVSVDITCTNDNCHNLNLTLYQNGTLVNTTLGATPFYTNHSNSYLFSLEENESETVNFWLNATGSIDSSWEFYLRLNKADQRFGLNITNETEHFYVNILQYIPPPELVIRNWDLWDYLAGDNATVTTNYYGIFANNNSFTLPNHLLTGSNVGVEEPRFGSLAACTTDDDCPKLKVCINNLCQTPFMDAIFSGTPVTVSKTKNGVQPVVVNTTQITEGGKCHTDCYASCVITYSQECVTECTRRCLNGICWDYTQYCGTGGETVEVCKAVVTGSGVQNICQNETLGSYTQECNTDCYDQCETYYNATSQTSTYNQSCLFPISEIITLRYNDTDNCTGALVPGYTFDLEGTGSASLNFAAPTPGAYDICSNINGIIGILFVNDTPENGTAFFTGIPNLVRLEEGQNKTYKVNFTTLGTKQPMSFDFSLERWDDNAHTISMSVPDWLTLTRGGTPFTDYLMPINSTVMFNLTVTNADILNQTTFFDNILVTANNSYFTVEAPFDVQLNITEEDVLGNFTLDGYAGTTNPANVSFESQRLSLLGFSTKLKLDRYNDILSNLEVKNSSEDNIAFTPLGLTANGNEKIGVDNVDGQIRVSGGVEGLVINSALDGNGYMRIRLSNPHRRFYINNATLHNISISPITQVLYTPEGGVQTTINPSNWSFNSSEQTLTITQVLPVNYASGSNLFILETNSTGPSGGESNPLSEWPMLCREPDNTAYYPGGSAVNNFSLLWNYTTGDYIYLSSPSISGGIVYIGSDDQNLYALNATTGAPIWTYDIGDAVETTPAIANGLVYVGADDNVVYALNATNGSHVWNYTTGNHITYSSPTVVDDVLYIGSEDNKIYALNATTGAEIWNYTTTADVHSTPGVSDGVVYVGGDDGILYALNATTGAEVWTYPTSDYIWGSSGAISNGIVYFGSDDSNAYALNATTGAQIWNYTTGDCIETSPAVANGVAYIGSADYNLYALNATTGAQIWNYTTGESIWDSSPAVGNGVVIFGSYDDKIYFLNATDGTLLWNYTTGDDIDSAPAIADGKVYCGSYDGKLYAFNAFYQLTPPEELNFTLSKTADFASRRPGQTINWTISFTNHNTYSINATLTDTNGQNFTVTNLASAGTYTTSYTTLMGCSSVTNTVSANVTDGTDFANNSTSEVVTSSHCGDGTCNCGETQSSCSADCGGGTSNCDRDWECTAWGSCVNGIQSRTCDCTCPHDADCSGDHDTTRTCTITVTGECNSSLDCAANETCINGTCFIVTPGCIDSTDCPGDQICVDGVCEPLIVCEDDPQCPTGMLCDGTICKEPCTTNADCPDEMICEDEICSDVCTSSDDCPGDELCINGTCKPPIVCTDDPECPTGMLCDGTICKEPCTINVDCPDEMICQDELCTDTCIDSTDCPGDEECTEGVCTPPAACTQDSQCTDGNDCTSDSCVNGVCQNTLQSGTSCNDGNPCTENDVCDSGTCSPGPGICECETDTNCNDNNPCTSEVCSNNECEYTLLSGTSCDDGDSCTSGDVCSLGICTPGEGVCDCQSDSDCEVSNPCLASSCIENLCQYEATTGNSCDDLNPCTSGDVCSVGTCVPGVGTCQCQTDTNCNDGDICTTESCVNNICEYDLVTVGSCRDDLGLMRVGTQRDSDEKITSQSPEYAIFEKTAKPTGDGMPPSGDIIESKQDEGFIGFISENAIGFTLLLFATIGFIFFVLWKKKKEKLVEEL